MDLLYASYAIGKTEKHLKDEFKVSYIVLSIFLRCWFTSVVKDPRHAWSLLGANIG